jgi:uncharacterized membrane protein YdfJ with MMPL/SSD domain|tara:strand:- start:9153 stop:9479 length:327 start_codon:yes stop_codon:yes gene_type:complete
MIDVASLVLADFQDTIVAAFGPSLGWIVGHAIVLLLILSTFWAIQNRHHILNESGWSYSNLMDISIIFLLTAVQYLIYANLLNFPEAASFGLALFWTMALRWHILVLE